MSLMHFSRVLSPSLSDFAPPEPVTEYPVPASDCKVGMFHHQFSANLLCARSFLSNKQVLGHLVPEQSGQQGGGKRPTRFLILRRRAWTAGSKGPLLSPTMESSSTKRSKTKICTIVSISLHFLTLMPYGTKDVVLFADGCEVQSIG